jgi:F420-non-reducing hydrogenase large subunit
MKRRITIDPITRLEGHGKIDIFLDDKGDVECAYLQVPDFKGFEKFCEGRAVEEMPTITQKICGVCPTAHHTIMRLCLRTISCIFSFWAALI